jgi:hypothetical protein
VTDLTANVVEQLAAKLGADPTETDLFDLRGRMAHMTETERETIVKEVISSAYTGAIDDAFASVGLNGPAWAKRIEAMAQQTEATKLLRQADHFEVVSQARALQAAAETKLAEAEQRAQALTAEVDRLTVPEVEALDRLADAEQHHGEVETQHQQYVNLSAKAARLSESLMRLDAAARILADRQREANTATSARASAAAALDQQRQLVAKYRTDLDTTTAIVKAVEDHPDAAPRSETTLFYAFAECVTEYNNLTKPEQAALRRMLANYSRATGADHAAVLRGRDQTLAEAQQKVDRARALTPARGGVTVHPPGIG